ncbi:MAG: 3-oxoacyl-ACP synthase III family protein [Saprospiraceae bacterium]
MSDRNAYIASVAAYAPQRVVTNAFFNDLLGEDVDTWLCNNVQIYERRWCAPEESVADLCERASLLALERAGIRADELDLIILATDTPEFVSPSTAAVVQHRLSARRAGTFDVNAACAGFVTALDIAAKYIQADPHYNKVLVVGGYAMSKYLNLEDKKTVTLFADGAGAAVLCAGEGRERGFVCSELRSKGEYHDWMGIYGGATRMPATAELIANHGHQLQFVKKFPKELNPEMWSDMAAGMCRRAGVKPQDVQHYFITQININAIWETMDRLQTPRERAVTVMHHYGYTGSACIPMAFNQAWEEQRVSPGDLCMFIGSGGGLAFAAALFRM